jgi:hypothetical protein
MSTGVNDIRERYLARRREAEGLKRRWGALRAELAAQLAEGDTPALDLVASHAGELAELSAAHAIAELAARQLEETLKAAEDAARVPRDHRPGYADPVNERARLGRR